MFTCRFTVMKVNFRIYRRFAIMLNDVLAITLSENICIDGILLQLLLCSMNNSVYFCDSSNTLYTDPFSLH